MFFQVQQAIYNNLQGRTVVIIAHRLSTVENAHRIVVLNKGSVVEQGTHLELLKTQGMYANIVQRQLLGFDFDKDKIITNGSQIPKESYIQPETSYGSFKSLESFGKSQSDDELDKIMGTPIGSFRELNAI